MLFIQLIGLAIYWLNNKFVFLISKTFKQKLNYSEVVFYEKLTFNQFHRLLPKDRPSSMSLAILIRF